MCENKDLKIPSGWVEHEADQQRFILENSTAEDRLKWLEDAIEFAYQATGKPLKNS